MESGNIKAIQKLLGHKSIRTIEIYAYLSDKHLYQVVSMLPSPNMVTVMVIPDDFDGRGIFSYCQKRPKDSELLILTTPTPPSELGGAPKGRRFGLRNGGR